MLYKLSKTDIEVIKSSLKAHLKQCEEFKKVDDKVKTFTGPEREKLKEKIERINVLLESM
jgi:hypothetical protein